MEEQKRMSKHLLQRPTTTVPVRNISESAANPESSLKTCPTPIHIVETHVAANSAQNSQSLSNSQSFSHFQAIQSIENVAGNLFRGAFIQNLHLNIYYK